MKWALQGEKIVSHSDRDEDERKYTRSQSIKVAWEVIVLGRVGSVNAAVCRWISMPAA